MSESQYKAWTAHLDSTDIDDLLSAAEFVGRKLGAPSGQMYGRWLEECFGANTLADNDLVVALANLRQLGVPIATLNYDTLLEAVTGLDSIKFSDTKRVAEWVRRETDGILHLHGVWNDPSSCVLGIRDYQSAALSDVRQFIQRNLSTFGRLLFVGCGDTFSDPNFTALISWMRDEMKGASPLHYALVRENELITRRADATWQGFVEPISYGDDYADLPNFLRSLFPSQEVLQHISQSQPPSAVSQVQDDRVLAEYRAFLLRDCGQMTIEGIRTDIDTAQRKFDLENLFVPLGVNPVPPEFPISDKRREAKLKKWQEENKGPISFGEAFTSNQRIALLALPGGGKTLLLKRLAVAYADEERRLRSNDFLPDLDIFPVLIRCREWREYIARPIPFILKNISNITGQAGLDNFYESLAPLLRSGKVVLLVDGLDEIHKDADRETFVENLEKFLDEYKKVRLVVTSREAGFALIAPTIARFCSRWRLAALSKDTIASLCDHWHKLMSGDTPEAQDDAREVADRLLNSPALRRLAENPLLLTMLLVVKHGAGRLPPDRVSLYSRAVEVLLDTWNIKGHEALNIKEALPQLSYIAYELMRRGKQTATQLELITLLEEARVKVPRIRMYAKDTPVEFLRRVELRSSLLMEAGYQLEGAKAVPFYQFRHLTFQEYLAAEAAVDGNYRDYKSDDTLLVPLSDYLDQEEWKEVIPMATVLARRQAEPVMLELLSKTEPLMDELRRETQTELVNNFASHALPPLVSLLLQCLAEETEASPRTLERALLILAVFARGCRENPSWDTLLKGLYSEEFVNTVFRLDPSDWPSAIWLRNTKAVALALSKPNAFWVTKEGLDSIMRQLQSSEVAEIERGLLTIAGAFWGRVFEVEASKELYGAVEKLVFKDDKKTLEPALWVYGLIHSNDRKKLAKPEVLDRLLSIMLTSPEHCEVASFALSKCAYQGREMWEPKLSHAEKELIESHLQVNNEQVSSTSKELGWFVAAFHARDVIQDQMLYEKLKMMDNIGISYTLVEIVKELEENLLVPEEARLTPRPRRPRVRNRR